MTKLWVEKYRPKTLNDYVFRDEKQKNQFQQWISQKSIPHLMMTGPAGTGKSSAYSVLLNELDVHPADIKIINASVNNGVDFIRGAVENFCSSMPFGDFKYMVMDEFDHASPNAQAALRHTMEKYSDTCRFILTANYPNKIIPALHSRCQGYHVDRMDRNEYTARLATILIEEGVGVDIDVLDTYVDTCYPDLRKAINLCQQNSIGGELTPLSEGESGQEDYRIEMVAYFKERQFKKGRELICKQINDPEEYEEMFTFMYQNTSFWADTDEKENEVIVTIRNGLVKHLTCADPEINLAATLCELEIIANG